MSKFQYWVLPLTLVLLLVSISAAAFGAAKTPYKIGAVFAVIGLASPLGTPKRDTALMFQEQINKSGGIDGHPVKIIIYDTKSTETDRPRREEPPQPGSGRHSRPQPDRREPCPAGYGHPDQDSFGLMRGGRQDRPE